MKKRKEVWVDLNYKNIVPDYYEISTHGGLRLKNSHKLLSGNNPDNEKGYVRVCLKMTTGKSKKFALHVLVCSTFKPVKFVGENEVNHIDGNKLNCSMDNLEWTTRKENAHHARETGLYSDCDYHYKAKFTNEEIHAICKCLQDGCSNAEIKERICLDKIKNVDVFLYQIRYRQSWKSISDQYDWEMKSVLTSYAEDDIIKMCEMLCDGYSEISNSFDYDPGKVKHTLRAIRRGRVHKTIYDKIIKEKRSTTIPRP